MNYALMLNPSFVRPFALKYKFNTKALGTAGFAVVLALIGFYIFQISSVTQMSFTVVDYEKRIDQLDKEFKSLQLNFSDASSLSGLEEALMARGYEKVGKINYIQVLDTAVAANK